MREGEEKKKGEQSDGRYRLNSSFSEEQFEMIDKLAIACGITPTRLQKEFVLLCLQNETAINYMQEKFKRRSKFKVIRSKIDGEMKFILADKKSISKSANIP